MADKTIGELPAASEVYDDSLLVMEQQGEARSVKGELIKKYAREATAAYVAEAKGHADDAKDQADTAQASADAAAESARDAADVALHPPILKEENDHWWIWDTELNVYKDSGIDAGVSLDVVEEIITGEPGTPASVANLGTKTDPRLQFTIPEGQKGDKGDAATIEVGKVTTGEPGTSASVKNSGTPNDAKLDFVIPQGPTGRGFTILGYYNTAEELKASVLDPSAGDAYGVGETEPYDIYIYDGNTNEWVNSGPINVDLPSHLIVGEDSELGTVLPVDADTLEGHDAAYFENKISIINTLLTSPEMHRNIFRGKNLGSSFTTAQKEAIAAGTFDDLYVGDYWTINGHTWRIADFNYWLTTGNPYCNTNHLVMIPERWLYAAQMTNTDSGAYIAGSEYNSTTKGYAGSDMRTKNLSEIKNMIEQDFGVGSILVHKLYLTSASKNGIPTASGWFDSEVDLMTEAMITGNNRMSSLSDGVNVPHNQSIDGYQLALFQVAPYYINIGNQTFWLQDIVSDTDFAFHGRFGTIDHYPSSRPIGVRPVFGIVGGV